MNPEILKNLKHNLAVNILDGGFFGFALGFASFSTILPLFVSNLTSSALLIGLIPAIHNTGWLLPQLFTTGWITRQKRYKSLAIKLSITERVPFLALAVVAALLTHLSVRTALVLTFGLLVVQGLGAGLTANPWTTMIGKIIPSDRRGTFFGLQNAAANILASLSALAAGIILTRWPGPQGFMVNYLLCSASLVVSWVFMSMTREPENQPSISASEIAVQPAVTAATFASLGAILKRDANFRWFLIARTISQIGIMGFAFYTVYAVRRHGASELVVGGMTSVMLATQIAGNMLMGWIGDRWNRKALMEIGLAAAAGSALLAWLAPSVSWYYMVYALAAIANVGVWTIGMTMILEFGSEADRPTYIGLANTLVAPANILAPFLGGWLADLTGYPAAFAASAAGAILALIVFQFFVKEPVKQPFAGAPSVAFSENAPNH